MFSWTNLRALVKEHFRIKEKEMWAIIVTVLISAFILSFRLWGEENFNLMLGLFNFGNRVAIVLLAVLVSLFVQKVYALNIGLSVDYKACWYALAVGLFFTFYTNGWIFILAPGFLVFTLHPERRIGKFRYGLNFFQMANISLAGVLSLLVLGLFFRIFSGMMMSSLAKTATGILLLWACFSMLPLPYFMGFKVFLASRFYYFFWAALVAGMSALIWTGESLLTILIGGIILGVLGFYALYWSEHAEGE